MLIRFDKISTKSCLRKVQLSVFLVGAFSIVSCKSHHYVTIHSGKSEFNKPEHKDSVTVSYRFNGAQVPIIVKVDNHSVRPIYVDWTKSSVVLNGERIPFYQNIGLIDTRTVSSTYDVSDNWLFREDKFTRSRTRGTIAFPESVSHIPDNSFSERYCGELSSVVLAYIKEMRLQESQNIDYIDETTFLNVRMHLTLAYDSDLKDSFIHTESSFVSALEIKGGKPTYQNLSANKGVVIQDKSREGAKVAVGLSAATLLFLAVINNFP